MNARFFIEEINQTFSSLLSQIIQLAPRLVVVMAVLLLGWLIATIVRILIRNFIFYLDGLVNDRLRGVRLKLELEGAAAFLSRTFFWFILIFTIAIGFQILGFSMISTWFEGLLNYLPNVIAAIVFVFAGIIVGQLVKDLVASIATGARIPNGKMLGRFARYLVLFITLIIAMDQLGINITFLTTIVAIFISALLFGGALAFGLGASSAVNNILGAYYTNKTYEVGDRVKFGDIEGVIEKITPTTIMLNTASGKVTIPAGKFNEESSALIDIK